MSNALKNVLMKGNCLIQIIYVIFVMKEIPMNHIIKKENAFQLVEEDMNQLI